VLGAYVNSERFGCAKAFLGKVIVKRLVGSQARRVDANGSLEQFRGLTQALVH